MPVGDKRNREAAGQAVLAQERAKRAKRNREAAGQAVLAQERAKRAQGSRAQFAAFFARLEQLRMPFGKYGPERCPPHGAPLYDLPYEYLAWFARKGFPEGELGELLALVYELKAAGADAAFAELRQRAGGRTNLHPPRRRHYRFDDQD